MEKPKYHIIWLTGGEIRIGERIASFVHEDHRDECLQHFFLIHPNYMFKAEDN